MTRSDVQNAKVPVSEMIARLDPKTHRGHKARFFAHVVRFATAAAGKNLTEAEIDSRASNLAHNFTRFAVGAQDTLPLGNDVAVTDLMTAWTALQNGTLNLDANGNGPAKPASGDSAGKTGTEQRREAEAANVPPVSQNVFASALGVFDKVRKNEVAPPRSADDAYEMLWDNLAEPVRTGRASGVISSSLAKLATENRDLFNGIITVLPDDAKAALSEVLIDRAYDTYKTSLKTTVEDVYHIGVGPKHANALFSAWLAQVNQIAMWAGKDEGLGWKPSEDQILEANRDHAVATFRALAEGLRAEVAASLPQPTINTEVLQPIQFNTIMVRLLSKGPEIMAEVGARWGNMTAEQQHAFVADMDAEDAKAAEPTTEVVPVIDAPKVETKAPTAPKNPPKP